MTIAATRDGGIGDWFGADGIRIVLVGIRFLRFGKCILLRAFRSTMW